MPDKTRLAGVEERAASLAAALIEMVREYARTSPWGASAAELVVASQLLHVAMVELAVRRLGSDPGPSGFCRAEAELFAQRMAEMADRVGRDRASGSGTD